jgi:glycosyltransferase involved in cell wall biosynthesis
VRIALVTRRYPPLIGGAERVLSYLAPALADQGAEVTVVTSAIPDQAAISSDLRSPVPIVRLPSSRMRFLGTIIYMRSLKKWLMEHRPDLIYVSMLKHDAYVAVEVGHKLKIPVVLRPEGAGDTGDLAWQKWGRFGRMIGNKCKQADAFVAISPAIHAELQSEGYEQSRIHDLPNGVPVPEQSWRRTSHEGAVFVGRLAPEKNLETLLEAWKIVVRSHREARLILVGDGPERPKLESKAAALNFGLGIVQFRGVFNEPERFLKEAAVFVLPSKEEGMSIALLEAMALGMPIVASDIPGNRQLIIDGVYGRLSPYDDPEKLALAILAQWHDKEAALKMATVARQRVIDEFSISAVARRHLELFSQLTSK